MSSVKALLVCLTVFVASGADKLEVEVQRNVPVPMRDGTILRADVCRPKTGGPYPVLVRRTPYGKGPDQRYAQAGFIVVVQDARGRYASDGKWESFVRMKTREGEDGYDTVEWAAKLPGSTGKVGTYGGSYNGLLQWQLAPLQPPSLVAMSAHSIPARYTDLEGPGTIRPGRRLHWWFVSMAADMRRRANRPGTHSRTESQKLWAGGGSEKWLNFLPWIELPREAFEDETEYVHHWLKNPHLDPWRLHEGCKRITVPNLNVVGWHDHCNGDMLLDKTMFAEAATETARKGTRLVIGPWSHAGRGSRNRFGNIDFGPNARLVLAALEIRWFDYWLKGKDNGIDKTAPVRIFVMGDNQWRDEQQWPLERAKPQPLFLTSGGNANTPGGNGALVSDASPAPGTDKYTFDPAKPVPSLHGPALFTIPTDQRPLADRQDILVYQTEPLDERMEVTGNPVVELCAASSAPDTDWFVRLIDVAPDGLARDVSQGMVRARYRNGLDKPELIELGKVVKYTIRMNPTSNAFLPGHRIRLDITSSDFPNYDRNHNTAANQNADAELAIAEQTVHRGGTHPTRIVLPVIEAGNQ
ncbi:MAG: CocE/NonD family hydrolase [Planctomycetes bacterium]|nr:CocE/NonD family hydrolase [Planctomycetota bacterium]